MARINAKLTVAQYRLLDKLARDEGMIPEDKDAGNIGKLEENGLVDEQADGKYRANESGVRYLSRHLIEGRKVIESDVRGKLTMSRIKNEYGFSDTLIRTVLPEPILVPNPRVRSGAPMRLWFRDEVEDTANKPEVREQLEKLTAMRSRRQAKQQADMLERLSDTDALVDDEIRKLHVIKKDARKVETEALRAKQNWFVDSGQYDRSVADATKSTRLRWTVNHIRHNLLQYDEDLFQMSEQASCEPAYKRYREAVFDTIAEAYPEFADECKRQKKPSIREW